ncbi:MAG: hypothetical protein ACLP59_13465 [Bryobacteraceae bacterium]
MGQDIGAAVIENPDVVVAIQRRKESAHVDRQDAEQRHTPPNIDKNDALGKVDRADTL